MRRIGIALLAASLTLLACSSPSSDDAADGVAEVEQEGDGRKDSEQDPKATSRGKAKRIKERDRDRPGKKERPEKKGDAGSPIGDGPSEDESSQGDNSSGGTRTPKDIRDGERIGSPSGSDRRGTSRPDPKAGRYHFAQQGWEEFCTGTCNRSDLPRTAQIDNSVSKLSGGGLEVVSESSSGTRRSTSSSSPPSR